jgi:hypothetical protein
MKETTMKPIEIITDGKPAYKSAHHIYRYDTDPERQIALDLAQRDLPPVDFRAYKASVCGGVVLLDRVVFPLRRETFRVVRFLEKMNGSD